jgi:hypothetical protein
MPGQTSKNNNGWESQTLRAEGFFKKLLPLSADEGKARNRNEYERVSASN